jgi:hypothetical protein
MGIEGNEGPKSSQPKQDHDRPEVCVVSREYVEKLITGERKRNQLQPSVLAARELPLIGGPTKELCVLQINNPPIALC